MGRKWNTPSRGNFEFQQLHDEIQKFIEQDKYAQYKITVGTDAQQHSDGVRFVSAICVYRVGRGAQYYWTWEVNEHINSLRQKIMYEASLTYKYKEELKDLLKDILEKYNIKVKPHSDIGENGPTKKFISEITGMFKGFGKDEEVLIKPYSITASCIANKHSK